MSGRAMGFPDNRRLFLFLCLGVLFVTTGCIASSWAGQAEQDNPVIFIGNNSANVAHAYTVWVVSGEVQPDGIVIHKKSGELDNASPGQGLTNYELGGDYGYVTSVEPPPNRSRLITSYTLPPGEENRTSVQNFTMGSTIVVSVSEDGRVFSLVAANCDEQSLVGLEVRSYPDAQGGVSASYGCR